MTKAIARRPDLARLGVQKAQAKIEAELAENQKLPALDVQLSASKDFGNGLASRRPVELEAQVLLDVPIQNRVAKGRSDAARALVSRISEQERGAKDRIGADVRDSMNAMDLAKARLGIAKNEVDVAESLEKAEWNRFTAGDSTLLVVNLREQATFDARLREVDAKFECQRALVLFRAATADLP
jgi:outer membrane protein TolC